MTLTTSLRPLSFLLILLSTFTSLISAQTVLDSSKLPSCFTKCTPLETANSACVPPTAPQANQGAYQDCFCQAPALTSLYTTPNGLCDSACSGSDLAQIQAWYLGLCHGGVIVTPAGGAQATKPAGTATTTDTSVTLNAPPTATATGAASGARVSSNGQPKSWISTHWQWVLLVIILFLAFVFFLVLGFWLKRRHRRRRDEQQFSGVAQMRNANSPSPFASGILAPSDGAYIGSRNHRPMSTVPDTRSVATMERIGSPRESMLAMSVYSREFHDVPSPPALGAGSRSMPWLGERQDSGETGGSVRSKMGGTALREEPVSPEEEPDVSPIVETPAPLETETSRRSMDSRRSRDGVRRKLSKKSNRGSIRERNDEK